MKIEKLSEIEGAYSFYLSPFSDILIYQDLSLRLIAISSGRRKVFYEGRAENFILESDNYFYFMKYNTNSSGSPLEVVAHHKETEKLSIIAIGSSLLHKHKNFLLLRQKIHGNYRIQCYNIISGAIAWILEYKFWPIISRGKSCFGFIDSLKGILYCVDFDTGKIVWEFHIEKLGTFTDLLGNTEKYEARLVLGIISDKIYIYLNSTHILELDISDINNYNLIKSLDKENSKYSYKDFSIATSLDEKNKIIIDLFWMNYKEYNLQDESFMSTNIQKMVDISSENALLFAFDNEYIYYMDKRKVGIGIVNRKSKDLELFHSLKDEYFTATSIGVPLKIQVKDFHIYILDNKNHIHIYKIQ